MTKKTAAELIREDADDEWVAHTSQWREEAVEVMEAQMDRIAELEAKLASPSPHDPGQAAIATLRSMGYEHHGGVQWAPPVREMAVCGCGDEYPANGWDAGFIAALGHCANCAAALDPVTPEPAPSTPWYPDDSGEWVEVPEAITTWPPGLNGSELVDVLMRGERDHKGWSTDSDLAWSWDWAHPCCHPSRIVAYKVVKP